VGAVITIKPRPINVRTHGLDHARRIAVTQPGRTDVDVAAMHVAHHELDATRTELDGHVRMFKDEINALMSTWTGDAANGFRNAMGAFEDECTSVLNALQNLSREVESSANEYARTHRQTTDLASNFGRSVSSASAGLPGF
jgi:ESAT-6 family protein